MSRGIQERVGGPYSYRALGYQQIAGSSAAQNLTPPTGATVALISVSGGTIRYRDDGVAPTAALGMPIVTGQTFQYSGDFSLFQFIASTSSPVLDILYYL